MKSRAAVLVLVFSFASQSLSPPRVAAQANLSAPSKPGQVKPAAGTNVPNPRKPDKKPQLPPEVSPTPVPVPIPNEKLESGAELMRNAPVKDSEQTIRQLFADGVELLKKNRAYEARECLEKAAYLAPRSAGIHCNLGLAYQNSGNINKAIGEFETALKLSSSMPEATLNLAGCYQSVGDNENAINWYEKYLEENPKSPQAQQVSDIVEALKKSLGKLESDPHGPDYFSSITKEGIYRWACERMPLRVYIEPGAEVLGYFARFDNVLMEAFQEWCKASGDNVTVKRVDNQSQADIFCSWTSNPQEVTVSGTQGERGSARIIAKGNNILRATLKILTKPFLEDGYLSDDDMKKACLHEVGHVLGLQGHSNNNHDVMFFTVDTSTVWPVLTKRDKATMARLYAPFVKKPESVSVTK